MEFSEQKSSGNELAFEALQEEYEIPTVSKSKTAPVT